MTNNYETMFVLSVGESEEATASLVERIKALVSANGTLDSVDEWGKRKLAYPINYENDGYYVVIDFTSDEAFPQELDRVINITDGVLRSLIVAKGE